MNDKIKSQLRKYLQNYDYENFVLGDSRLNASVYKKFLFPYNALDYARNLLADTIKNYSIYFVLSCGRKEIKSYEVHNEYVDIKYCDIDNGEIKKLSFNFMEEISLNYFLLKSLQPFFEYKICKSGSSFKVYISTEQMEKLKAIKPDSYYNLPEECKKTHLFFEEFDIYHMIWENAQDEKPEEYDLLYIGKSNAQESDFDILKRLNSHKTIQKITRENNLYYRSKELMIMIFSFKSKLFRPYNLDCYLAHIMLGNSGWEKAKLLTNIKENQEMILFIEAMLINHFKPKYNQQYVDKLSISNREKTISTVTEERIEKALLGVTNVAVAKTVPYSFKDELGNELNSDIDYAIYDFTHNKALIIEAKWIDKHYKDEIDKIYGKIFQTLNSIYTKQIDKHKKFLQKQENIDFLFSNDKNYRKGLSTPEIYYLAVDKRNQMHIDERHMVSEYMLIYFIHKYVSDNQIDLESMWKEINGLQTKVEYIAVSNDYFEISVGDEVVLVEQDDLYWR